MDPASPAPAPPSRRPRQTAPDPGGPGPSAWGAHRDRARTRRRRRQAAALLVTYVALVGLVTLTPDSVDRGVHPCLMRGVLLVQHHGFPGFRYSMIEEVANVALFAPLGMLGVLAVGPRRWWLVALTAVALSAAVELAQGAFLPARVASVTDVAANGLGAVLGAGIAAVVALRTRRRGRLRS
jgi:hypothetical protein